MVPTLTSWAVPGYILTLPVAAEMLNVIGEVAGKVAITVDDEIDTGGSLVGTVSVLQERGAKEVYACCTHPVFSGLATQRIDLCPVKEVVVADTIPVTGEKKLDKIGFVWDAEEYLPPNILKGKRRQARSAVGAVDPVLPGGHHRGHSALPVV